MSKFHKQVDAFKVHLVISYLRRNKGNQIKAAADMGVCPRTLAKVLSQAGITSQELKAFISGRPCYVEPIAASRFSGAA